MNYERRSNEETVPGWLQNCNHEEMIEWIIYWMQHIPNMRPILKKLGLKTTLLIPFQPTWQIPIQ